MKIFFRPLVASALGCLALAVSGCGAPRLYQPPPPVAPLGTINDSIWKMQEENAEASDFVVYQHEFGFNGARLNTAGEDHLKEVAVRVMNGQDFPVVIERSFTTARENTQFKYAVHPNPELDLKRRQVVVRLLTTMGVHDAEDRVVVADAFAQGQNANVAAQSYNAAIGGGFQAGGFGGLGFGGFANPFGGGGFGGGFF